MLYKSKEKVKVLEYQEKWQTLHELLQHIIYGPVLIWNDHESIWRAVCAVLQWAVLCIASAEGHFEQHTA
jgi:hypothetical protein